MALLLQDHQGVQIIIVVVVAGAYAEFFIGGGRQPGAWSIWRSHDFLWGWYFFLSSIHRLKRLN